jgi:hemolysin III
MLAEQGHHAVPVRIRRAQGRRLTHVSEGYALRTVAETAEGCEDRVMVASDAKPLLRGALHQGAFMVALVVGALLIAYAEGGRRRVAASVFAGSVVSMLGASALYHRVTWSPRARPWMRRVDHAGIYVLIAGSYTPVGLLSLHGTLQRVTLAIVWAGAAVAIALKFIWVDAPKWLAAVTGIALGWAGVVALPQVADTAGIAAVVLLAVGGLAYTAGAIVYATRRPDPYPRVFGYHEVFHALTLVAVTCQYVAIAFFVVKVA